MGRKPPRRSASSARAGGADACVCQEPTREVETHYTQPREVEKERERERETERREGERQREKAVHSTL